MSGGISKTKSFNTRKSVSKAKNLDKTPKIWQIKSESGTHVWFTTLERIAIIRKGIPYSAIEIISERLNRPVKYVLSIIGIPQTTYNKKKSEHSLLDSGNSEKIVLLTELLDYGLEVFNNEEDKFQRWLKKQNISLGGNSPESLLDTATGIEEVRFCLNRIEFGNFA